LYLNIDSLFLFRLSLFFLDMLYASLKQLGLDEDKEDPVLGDWKKLIDYFVKEMYIHRQKVPGRVSASGATISEYRWGGRALLEVDKIGIMRHVAAMFGESLDPLIVQEIEKAEQQKRNQMGVVEAIRAEGQSSTTTTNGGMGEAEHPGTSQRTSNSSSSSSSTTTATNVRSAAPIRLVPPRTRRPNAKNVEQHNKQS